MKIHNFHDLLEFAALQALKRTPAFTIEGMALMPALSATIANGDCAAVPVAFRSFGSLEGMSSPIIKIVNTV